MVIIKMKNQIAKAANFDVRPCIIDYDLIRIKKAERVRKFNLAREKAEEENHIIKTKMENPGYPGFFIMFESIYTDKFKPFNDDKLQSRLNEDELELIRPLQERGMEFKLAVYINVHSLDPEAFRCPCGAFVSFRTAKKDTEIKYCSKSCATSFTGKERTETKYKNFGGKEAYTKYVTELQLKNSGGIPHQKTSRTKNTKTLMERYGVSHNSQLQSVKDQRMVKEDGVFKNVMNTNDANRKSRETWTNRSSEEKAATYKKFIRTLRSTSNIDYDVLLNVKEKIPLQELMTSTGCSRMTAYRFLDSAGLMDKKYTQDEISEFVRSLGFETQETRKVIPPYELDVYIPEKKLAIEYNGLYWHSSGSKETDEKWSKYHLMKTERCEEAGIQLLHIFENEWINPVKKEIWKSVIRHKLGLSKRIYARKCVLKEIDSKTANEFIERNHLQGRCTGTTIARGLYHEDKLVQVVTLGKARYNKNYQYELMRMCSELNTCIIGGASRLLKGLSFISYGNRRWCSALSNVYDSISTRLHITQPCYYYIDHDKIYHRSSFMKHKLKDKLKSFDSDKTEVENCYANGLRRIWDSGNLVYIKE